MIKNYWNSAFRNMMRNKRLSIINIFGLAIGMAFALMIFTYVAFEFNFDKMHKQHKNIYRVESTFHEGDVLTDYWATSSFGYGSAMKKNIPGVEDYTRVGSLVQPEQIVKFEELTLRENKIAYADAGFFRLFDFELIKGNRETSLSMPRQVVVTEHIAKKYFKDEEPIGKILIFNSNMGKLACEVTGIIKDMPSNSHFHYNFIISDKSLPDYLQEYWYRHEVYTYVLLDCLERKEQVEEEFPIMAEKYKTEEALRNKTWGISLVPLADIHLTPQVGSEMEKKGNKPAMIALIFAAIAILIIAWINYINLTVSSSLERAKEIGVRKVVGAFRKQLISQFLFESLVINLIALVLAIGLIEVSISSFNQMVGRTVSFSVWINNYWWILLVLIFILGIFTSGYYSTVMLLNRKPAILLKGKFLNSKLGERIRKVLVVIQYVASMVLLCGTLIVFSQLNFMRGQSLGIKTDQIMIVKFPGQTEGLNIKLEAMKKSIAQLPLVSKVTFSGAVPGKEVATFLSNYRTKDVLKQNRLYEMLTCDTDYIDAYGLELVAGRGFSEAFGDDKNKLVINEMSVRSLGFTSNNEAIGEQVTVETLTTSMQIIGVVKDYHQQALNKKHTPIMLIHKDKISWLPLRYISIVMTSSNSKDLIPQVEEIWHSYFEDSSYDYFFLDQFFDYQYRQDEVFGIIIACFTGLAIFISCFGLWVLVMFSCVTRTKEMGIRKVLGASRFNLFYQLGNNFFQLILISVIIALPIAWFSMDVWLDHYAFRMEFQWWFFVLPVVLMLVVSFVTVACQTVTVINSKPIRLLRSE